MYEQKLKRKFHFHHVKKSTGYSRIFVWNLIFFRLLGLTGVYIRSMRQKCHYVLPITLYCPLKKKERKINEKYKNE